MRIANLDCLQAIADAFFASGKADFDWATDQGLDEVDPSRRVTSIHSRNVTGHSGRNQCTFSPMRWVGYCRVSFVGGRSGDSFRSPTDQADAIREWVARRGDTVEILEPELDESGGNADRPILTRAIEGIESGRWDGLVVAYLSRASRSTRHLLEMWERIENAGGQVVAVAENIDTSTPTGRMQRTMLAAIAEHELDQHRERFANLRAHATAAGIWQRRQVPIGYKKDPQTRRLIPSEDAPRVAKAFADRIAGKSLTDIGRDLSRTSSGVRAMLRNRVYLGELHVGENVNTEAHPPIIDLPTFEAVQSLRQMRPARSDMQPSLLAGIIRCQSCGHVMRRGKSGGSTPAYTCHGTHSLGRCPRPVGIIERKANEYVLSCVRAEMETWKIAASRSRGGTEGLRDKKARAEAELAAYLEATQAAGIGIADFADGAKLRRKAVDDAAAELESAVRVLPIEATFDSGADALDVLDVRRKNQLLRGLLDAVVVAPVGHGANVPAAERVRIFAAGTLPPVRKVDGITIPIEALPFPAADDERLLGVHRSED
jgi:DNA invertase Pin-like site-specific DNA recombinase